MYLDSVVISKLENAPLMGAPMNDETVADARPFEERYPELVAPVTAFAGVFKDEMLEGDVGKYIHVLIAWSSNHTLRRVVIKQRKLNFDTVWAELKKVYSLQPFIDNRKKYNLDVADGWMDRELAADKEWLTQVEVKAKVNAP